MFQVLLCIPNNLIKHQSFIYTQFNVKSVLFQTIQFRINTLFCYIWPIDMTLTRATTPGQSGPGSDGNEQVLRILQSSSITGASPSDCYIQDSRWGSLTPLQRCNQLTGPANVWWIFGRYLVQISFYHRFTNFSKPAFTVRFKIIRIIFSNEE